MELQEKLNKALNDAPNLGRFGFREPTHPKFAIEREQLLSGGLSGVEAAIAFLQACPWRKTVNRDFDSYFIKHAAEKWSGQYVANGELILAALVVGMKVERCDGGVGVNAMLNLSSSSKWQVRS
jgi:hypothetical protein